ncbi:unnamed protein product [Xylocopa violacea]|uniref:Uncharacterized protein n=1 Tax=Xylocopa violacea TaxID=135666 RepID=A0ABP1NFV8_XYLVO
MVSKRVHLCVVLLSLSWPRLITAENADLKGEVPFDQVATASENVAQSVEKPEQKQEFRNQLITSIIDTTVHYENSNGFVPMLVSPSPNSDPLEEQNATSLPSETSNVTWTNSVNESDNSSGIHSSDDQAEQRGAMDIENDPAYSTEARIFLNLPNLNRRSFEYQGSQNEFELLKVRNDTPVVANYPDLYEDPPNSDEIEDENGQSSSKRKTQSKEQKMKDYMGNYGVSSPENNYEDTSYTYYYPHNSMKDTEKNNREEEKVANSYHQQQSFSYDSNGQSASKQQPTAPSFPGTNQEVNAFPKTNVRNNDNTFDSMSSSSQVMKNYKFSRPVVVAETNYKYSRPSAPSGSGSDDYQNSGMIDSIGSAMSHHYIMDNRNGRYRSEEDSRDTSDDSDYIEYREKSRRVQKSRRRPNDGSKRYPKEHRGSPDDSREYEGQGKRYHSSRTKSRRQRIRGNSWTDDDRHLDQDDSYEDTRYDGRSSGSETRHTKAQSSKFKPSTSWNQISPNLEISHSSGIEIGQLEKPKLIVPVKVNLVPVANFDHATAIGNSQGFGVSDAVLRNMVSATPGSTLSTPVSGTGSGGNAIGHDSKLKVSTPVPDIIVGQNSFQNSMQAVLSQFNDQNKLSTSLNLNAFKPQYVSSTVAPVLAVTPNLNPSLQSIPIQGMHDAVTPRPAYVSASNQVLANQMPQLIMPQPTLQTVPTLVQTPVTSSDYIQVNPHGMHGQNPISYDNLQVHPLPTMPTITPTPQTIPVTKINLLTADSQSKKILPSGSDANFLASASMAVGHGDQRGTYNGNPYYFQSSNAQQMFKPQMHGGLYQQMLKNMNVPSKTKTYIQTTHLLPAVLHPMPTFATLQATTPQTVPEQQSVQGTNLVLQSHRDQGLQFLKMQNSGFDNSASTLRSVKYPALAYQSIDTVGSHSSNNANTLNTSPGVSGSIENAHLPHVGTRNVEILNPNIKPSPVDTTIINSYGTMHYPAAVLTTSIPMFTTTSFVTARPAVLSTTVDSTNVQSLVNSLTEIGSKGNQASSNDLKAYQSQDRPAFNPINFVPNLEVVKNQNALNSKLHMSEPLQQNLNLVPLIPGGNFFKPSFPAQSELVVKPKLTSDLETYAEQMFKESLKTIYNSQKWNNDRKQPGNNRQNVSEADIAKLQNELQRLKASLSDSKRNKDQLEGHHSESKPQTAELSSKKPDELLAAFEQMLKSRPTDHSSKHHGNSKPQRHRRPSDQDKYNSGSSSDFRDTKPIREFLTPPQPSSHRSKGQYHDKPGKKRPGPPRFNNRNHYHGPKSHRTNHRSNSSPKAGSIEASSSNLDPVHIDDFPQYENFHESRQFRTGSQFDTYAPAFKASRDRNSFPNAPKHHREFDSTEDAFNHPKVHNLFGLLMKNNKLPNGGPPNYFRDKNQLKQFFEDEKRRMQHQFYDDSLKDYYYKVSEGMLYSNMGHGDTRRSYPEQRTIRN